MFLYNKLVTQLCGIGWVRTDEQDNIELTIDSNEFAEDLKEFVIRTVEDICKECNADCMLDRDGETDDGLVFNIADVMLVVIFA